MQLKTGVCQYYLDGIRACQHLLILDHWYKYLLTLRQVYKRRKVANLNTHAAHYPSDMVTQVMRHNIVHDGPFFGHERDKCAARDEETTQ